MMKHDHTYVPTHATFLARDTGDSPPFLLDDTPPWVPPPLPVQNNARQIPLVKRMLLKSLQAVTLFGVLIQTSPAGIITTVAGGGVKGDGAAGTSAQLNQPNSVNLDRQGNLYIADSNNHRIRKLDTAGIVSTVAGGGMGGDGNAATSAQLHYPTDVIPDSRGNFYIADYDSNRVRKVDTKGTISTVAGTGTAGYSGDGAAATSAQLNSPASVTLDSTGNLLYIADSGNHRIRKVNISTGLISTVAGTGTGGYNGDNRVATDAQLNQPYGIALDRNGNLYIADSTNNRIRKVDAMTRLISTVAGTGEAGSGGDGAVAINVPLNVPTSAVPDVRGNLYITEYNGNRVRKVDGTTGIISTVAGDGTLGFGTSGDGAIATSAQLASPAAAAIDSQGNLYIADTLNNRVRKVDATTGFINALVGDGTTGGSGGDGAAAINAQLASPEGVTLDNRGNLYISEYFGQRVRKVDAVTGLISTVAGTGTEGFNGDGIAANSAQLNYPGNIAVDSNGNLYIADIGSHRVRKIDSAGMISTVAGNGVPGYSGDGAAAINAQLNVPTNVTPDSSGNLYISETNNHCVRKVDATGLISTVVGNGTAGYSGDGAMATDAQLNSPDSIILDSRGNLYISDTGNSRIRKVDTNGIISTVAGNGTEGDSGDGGAATLAQLNSPMGLAIDGFGNLYIADSSNNRIRKVDTAGLISTVVGTGTPGYSGDGAEATEAQLNGPFGVSMDSSGNLYIGDAINSRIRKVLLTGSRVTETPTVTPALASSSPAVDFPLPIFVCTTTGNINEVCNYSGRTVTDLEIQSQGMISNGILAGTLVSTGWVSNFTITATGKLSGGVVTGYIKNDGVMRDFKFVGMSIIGGTLGGVIQNNSDVGGYFQDVTLQANTKITGGSLKGTIKGDKNTPAVLEDVRVKSGSKLSGVKLGKNVTLEKGVVVEDKQ